VYLGRLVGNTEGGTGSVISVWPVIRPESNLASADVDEDIGIVRKLRLRIRRGTG
jgi:hypothetical protein